MKAFVQNGLVHQEVEIIPNVSRASNGSFHPTNVNVYAEGGPVPNPNSDIFDIRVHQINRNHVQSSLYGMSADIESVVVHVTHVPKTYRFLGDLSIYGVHQLSVDKISNFMLENFHVVSNGSTPIGILRSYETLPYICSTKTIRRTYTPKVKTANESWDKIKDPAWVKNKKTNLNFFSKDRDRAFCMGCSLKTETSNRILMTAIDTDTNRIVLLALDTNCAREIKNLYIKSNKNNKYDKVEKWLYENDLTISNEDNGYSIISTPTKYNDLSGTSFFLNHKCAIIAMMHNQAYNYNGYVGECYYDEIIKNDIAVKCTIDIDKKEAIFIDTRKGGRFTMDIDFQNHLLMTMVL